MSNAHRPTFHPAKGGGTGTTTEGGYFTGGARGGARSAKDQAAHTRLKFRDAGQASADDIAARDLRRDLEAKEREHFEKLRRERERRDGGVPASRTASTPMLADAPAAGTQRGAGSSAAADPLAAFDDADDDAAFAGDGEDGGDRASAAGDGDGVDDDEEDDSAELMRELERIRREREEERERKERELAELAAKETTEAVLKGNPLLTKGAAAAAGGAAYGGGGSAAVKRRFGDDTVFSHTHAAEPDAKRRFINDSIRSDFHRAFLRRFIH